MDEIKVLLKHLLKICEKEAIQQFEQFELDAVGDLLEIGDIRIIAFFKQVYDIQNNCYLNESQFEGYEMTITNVKSVQGLFGEWRIKEEEELVNKFNELSIKLNLRLDLKTILQQEIIRRS